MKTKILAASVLALCMSQAARADVLYTYYDSTTATTPAYNQDGSQSGVTYAADSFSASNTNFNSVTLSLSSDNQDGASVMVYLAANVDGAPDLSALQTIGSVSDDSLTASASPVTLSIPSVAVSAAAAATTGDEYWIVLQFDDNSGSSWWYGGTDASGTGMAGQYVYTDAASSYSADGGVVSDVNGAYAMIVSDTSSPENTPEPASLALLGAGVAGIGMVRRRFAKKA